MGSLDQFCAFRKVGFTLLSESSLYYHLTGGLSERVEVVEVLLDGVYGGEGLATLGLDVGGRAGGHAATQKTL